MSKHLSVVDLREKLAQETPLPKDRWVTRDHLGLPLHNFHQHYIDGERTFLRALTDPICTRGEMALAVRIATCRPSRRCGSWICYYCRHLYWRSVQTQADAHLKWLREEHFSYVTIIAGGADLGIPHVESLIEPARDAVHKTLARWPSVRAFGRFEVDYWSPHAVWKPEKLRTVTAIDPSVSMAAALLVPHLHVIILHPEVHREALRFHLKKEFPAVRQVVIKPPEPPRTLRQNIHRIIGYSVKFKPPEAPPPEQQLPALRFYRRMMDALGGLEGLLHFDHAAD